MSATSFTQVARSTPFDNATNGYDSDKVQSALEEIDFRQETKEPTGFVNLRNDSVMVFNESTRTLTISPTGSSYRYFIAGHEFIKTGTDAVAIDNFDGKWFIYYSGSVLTASQTPWTFDGAMAFVASIYWNASQQKAVIFNEERHGVVMDWASHRYLHLSSGLALERYKFDLSNYILRGNGTSDTHATVGYSDLGVAFDEDLEFTPINSASPTLPYEQKIAPILWAPVLYRTGATGVWNYRAATEFPLAWTAGQRISYNQWTGTTWQLTQATEGYFVNTYICISDDPRHPFVAVVGPAQYQAVVDAAGEQWSTMVDSVPTPELRPIIKLIYKTSTGYTNQPLAILFAALAVDTSSVDNDRYTVEVGYNGNATVGKYMDRSVGASTLDNPFTFPEASFIRWITLQGQRGTNNTGTITIYKVTNLSNPVITVSLQNSSYVKVPFSQYFLADDQIALKLTSGSINKPMITMWIQTQLG